MDLKSNNDDEKHVVAELDHAIGTSHKKNGKKGKKSENVSAVENTSIITGGKLQPLQKKQKNDKNVKNKQLNKPKDSTAAEVIALPSSQPVETITRTKKQKLKKEKKAAAKKQQSDDDQSIASILNEDNAEKTAKGKKEIFNSDISCAKPDEEKQDKVLVYLLLNNKKNEEFKLLFCSFLNDLLFCSVVA